MDITNLSYQVTYQFQPVKAEAYIHFESNLKIGISLPVHSQVEFILYAGQHLHRLHPEKKKCSHYKRGPINMETIMIMMMIGTRDTVHGTGEHDRNSSVAIKPG